MDAFPAAVSPQLLAANRRLHALRAEAQARRAKNKADEDVSSVDQAAYGLSSVLAQDVAALPAHLGWESAAVTAVMRRHCSSDGRAVIETTGSAVEAVKENGERPFPTPPVGSATHVQTFDAETVKLYPDIGLGMLRREKTAPGRLWLMLRYLDRAGEGSFRIANIKETLTKKNSNLRLCGWRQLRNLLRDGEGLFWTRDKERVWLRSAAKVAYGLGVERLTGRPVALPLAALLDGIGAFRAHLYAAFHSGRQKATPAGETRVMPISRETMAGLSGVGRSSQRTYETQAGVQVAANFAVGEAATGAAQETRAWQKGPAVFELKDYRGRQGKKGKTYLAWQLPNSYIGQHRKRPKGRQRRINRELKDLVMKGMPGNSEESVELSKPEKMYYPNGKLAAQAYGRRPGDDLYWPRQETGNGRFGLWQQIGG